MKVSKTVVKKSKGMGMGLFAGEDIKFARLLKDRPVIIMFEYKTTTPKKWEIMSKKLKLPELAGIHKFDKVKYDPKFTDPKNPPKWYRLNHSGNPNAIMKSKGKFLYWVPLRDIKKGEEIKFDYKEPDPTWQD